MSLIVKICGLKTPESLNAALDAGADMLGFVFFEKSPRHVEPLRARELAARIDRRAQKVALVVNADDGRLGAIVDALEPDWLQLHGSETPERVRQVREKFGLPVMKALGVAEKADLLRVADYASIADRLLFDAKPPKGAEIPGGNGLPFDWALLRDHPRRGQSRDWMLSGGLTPENVGAAIRLTNAPGVDVSSGVETAPGEKSVEKMRAFLAAARSA